MMDRALAKIADDLRRAAAEMEAGHPIDPEILTTAARRLDAQAETWAKGIDRE